MESTVVYCGYNGIMEKNTETTVVYWGCIGIMENKMETLDLAFWVRRSGAQVLRI